MKQWYEIWAETGVHYQNYHIQQTKGSSTIWAEFKLIEDYGLTTAGGNKELHMHFKFQLYNWLFIYYCTLQIPALLWRKIV